MSQEDSVVVLSPSSNKKFLGGAGIVAAHASTLGAKCTLISVTGDDKHSNFIKNKLESFGVYPIIFKDESRITTLKQRFKVDNKIAMRLNYLRQNSISKYFQQKVLNNFKRISLIK